MNTKINLKKITLLSLNTYGVPFFSQNYKKRIFKIAQYFNNSSIDIIHLQEVFTYDHLFTLRRRLSRYPYFVYSPSVFGPKGGLVTISRWPIEKISYKTFQKRGYLFDNSIIQVVMLKGMLLTKFKNTSVYFLNTHFTANPENNWSQESKYFSILQSQVREFHTLLQRPELTENVTIISGDFNIAKDSVLGSKLIKFPGLIDVFAEDISPTFHQEFIPRNKKARCVDHLFIYTNKRKFRIQNPKKIFTKKVLFDNNVKNYLSDHIAIQATIGLL